MEVTCDYTAASTNNKAKGLTLVPQFNHIIHAVCNLVVVVDATTQRVLETLKHHEANITAVTSVTFPMGDSFVVELITCSEDGRLCVWRSHDDTGKYTLNCVLTDMQHSVVALDAITSTSACIVCASDSKGNIYIWARPHSSSSLFHVVHKSSLPPAQMPNCLCLHELPLDSATASPAVDTCFLVALGGVDARIIIKTFSVLDLLVAYNVSGTTSEHFTGILTGHEDWITCLAFRAVNGELMLASGSQDAKIRLWRVARCNPSIEKLDAGSRSAAGPTTVDDLDDEEGGEGNEEALAAGRAAEEDFGGSDEARCTFSIRDTQIWFAIYLEALLIGHEDWVTSVHWVDMPSSLDGALSSLQLFSTSMDRNMLLWEAAEAGGVWIPVVRIGDIGGNLGGSVGANLLGFVNGSVTPSGRYIIGVGFGGSFHLWQRGSDVGAEGAADDRWHPKPFPTGHFGLVTDICWAHDGSYLLSVSSDQTCRLHARIDSSHRPRLDIFDSGAGGSGVAAKVDPDSQCWREVARPQIHGYDLNAVACSPSVPFQFFSGGDEKVIRVFESSQVVIDGLGKICVDASGVAIESSHRSKINRAFIPALGLSNKAADLMSTNEIEEQESRRVEIMDWSEPPLEGQLADHTLWPEIKKLFGHTGDVMCIAISHSGQVLATACKGRNPETSSIMLWNTITMATIGSISAHESTVVCIRFSPDDRFIVSTSKDRGLCVSVRSSDGSSYQAVALHKNAHKRIIWDCSWCGSNRLVTGSRDGSCKFWSIVEDGDSVSLSNISEFRPFDGVAVTALDIAPSSCISDGSHLLVTGAESGDIKLWRIESEEASPTFTLLHIVNSYFVHGLAVKRIRWCPVGSLVGTGEESLKSKLQFASCGEDHCVRIFSVVGI